MVRFDAIRSLTDFQRNAKEHLKRLKKSGEPEVLTVNGHAELVVQSARSYQQLMDAAEIADSVRTLRGRLNRGTGGRRDVPLKEFDGAMRKKYGIRGK
jgi:PHD/YefM family antitoxin component YafN of YafNO toxin-antitoxin module